MKLFWKKKRDPAPAAQPVHETKSEAVQERTPEEPCIPMVGATERLLTALPGNVVWDKTDKSPMTVEKFQTEAAGFAYDMKLEDGHLKYLSYKQYDGGYPDNRQIIQKRPDGWYQRIVEGERGYREAETFLTESQALKWFLDMMKYKP